MGITYNTLRKHYQQDVIQSRYVYEHESKKVSEGIELGTPEFETNTTPAAVLRILCLLNKAHLQGFSTTMSLRESLLRNLFGGF